MISTFAAGLLLYCYAVYSYPTSGCTNKPSDVVFILDSSNSIWPGDFTKQTAFVRHVVQQFDVGPGPTQTRVGALTFGHEVWKQFDLKDKVDVKGLIKSIDDIQHGRGRRTNTGDAIKFAVEDMFTVKAGHRPGVTRVAVVITDGRSQDTISTKNASKLAHDSGIKTFAVGVGRYIDLNELQVISSDPNEDYLYMVDDFNALASIQDKLAKKACDVTEAPLPVVHTTTPTPEGPSDQSLESCGGKPADVFFIVDSSGSISSKDFNKEIQFVQSVVKLFDIASDKTRIGIINFSHESKLVVPLDNGLEKNKLLSKIRNIEHLGGGTYTADALRMVRQNGFTSALERKDAAKIVIVLTDGLSVNEDLTLREAKLTQTSGIKVFAIGIGPAVDLVEIKNIASEPDDTYVFQVDDFSSLETIKEVLAIKTCGVKPEIKDDQKDQPSCQMKKNTDMMFIYDSAALGPAKSDLISQFIATIVNGLDISSGFLNIGRITDNCPTGGNFQLSNRLNAADFQSIGFSSYTTLLKKVRRAGFTAEYGGRDDATNTAVLFIDSDLQDSDGSALSEATLLQDSAEVFVITIGNSPVITEFSKSFRGNNHLHVNSIEDLKSAAKNLLSQLCYFFTIDFADYHIDYVVPV